jgi:hypothetical protein
LWEGGPEIWKRIDESKGIPESGWGGGGDFGFAAAGVGGGED